MTEVSILDATSSVGRFPPGFAGGTPHLQSQEKAPWGRGCSGRVVVAK